MEICLPHFRRTKYKTLDVCMQFQDGYPDQPIIIEIKSKTLPEKLRDGLTKICDEQAKGLLGKPQVIFGAYLKHLKVKICLLWH